MILDEAIVLVASYIQTDNWLLIKRELLTLLSNDDRKNFSTRDVLTKKQKINAFEAIIIDKWEATTGTRPFIPDDKRA